MRKTEVIKFLNPEESKKLFKKIKNDYSRHSLRNQAIFYLAKYCALRASEIGLLRICDYDSRNKSIYIHRVKGSRNTTLLIVDPVVLNIFERYYWIRKQSATSSNDAIFISQKGQPISRKTLDNIMKNYCDGTDIPEDKQHMHVLRHTRAMELIDYPNVELRDVQWWLGHKNIQNTMIYLDFSIKAMKTLFEKIAKEEGGTLSHAY